jgi:hypothetical protein
MSITCLPELNTPVVYSYGSVDGQGGEELKTGAAGD